MHVPVPVLVPMPMLMPEGMQHFVRYRNETAASLTRH